ncbi:GNAT family N-acetyltransferase [Flavobacterium cellulosilyticum]|uniref:N-acetyltransferase n=1 Tax=Flavobacterium cellulosilyticum TaxID=2541731 RepID=A0A4R5CKL9_9FLAO|nr:GNAT family N-acetyltransferase [Flavobacterium cellulosilyticum]TDD97984.1 N-acetyltransferase [Flavobacterium cellulosilyticum]
MVSISFNPFPNLETERLYLRRIVKEDVNEIFALRSNKEIMKYVPRPIAKSNEEAMEHITLLEEKLKTNEGINWAITLKSDPKLIGIIGHFNIKPEHYRSEIGYMLLPEYHGKGIISEAVKKVVKYGFIEMKLHSIAAIIDPENLASEKVLQKNGFIKEAHLKENEFYQGRFVDTVIYSLLNKHFSYP